MTKRNLTRCFRIAIAIYVIAVVIGIIIRIYDKTDHIIVYSTFKDAIPFVIAIPAVWLGYCLQRRLSYLQQLRSLWSRIVEAIQQAIHYTFNGNPTKEEYINTLKVLSVAIDEVRGVFKNLGESDKTIGLYPFEPIKDIYGLTKDLGLSVDTEQKDEVRQKIFALWREARKELLKEFDREVPTFPHSHWAQPEKTRVYKRHNIRRKAT